VSKVGQPGEVSPNNPGAVRGPHGIWNEVELPILLWEVASQRKVIPVSVQMTVSHWSPVVRVSIDVDEKIRTKHSDVLTLYEGFDLESWSYVREIEEIDGHRWEFVQIMGDITATPWPLMTVIGRDGQGSLNLISLHRRNRRWMKKLVRGSLGFERRLK
jgi:hypothetical protein